jgi:P-type Cu2+ transporter
MGIGMKIRRRRWLGWRRSRTARARMVKHFDTQYFSSRFPPMAIAAALPVDSTTPPQTVTLDVTGMKCAGCVSAVEKQLQQVPGVERAIVNLVTEVANVDCDGSVVPADLAEALTQAGFPSYVRRGAGFQAEIDQGLHDLAERRQQQAKRQKQDLAIAIFLLAASSLGHLTQMLGWSVPALTNDWFHGTLALATLSVPGRPILWEGWQGIRRHAPNMNTLIGLGAVTAFVTSAIALLFPQLNWECFFAEPTMLIGFILLGRTLEQRARNRAASALQSLAALQPKTARVVGKDKAGADVAQIDWNQPLEMSLDLVQAGDWVQVLPGEQVPVDGVVLQGTTTIDESMLTGEAVPVTKQAGDSVSGGTMNQSGAFVLRVSRVGHDTTLARIIKLVEDAQSRKAPIQQLADRIAGYFTYGVLTIAAITFAFWFFWGSHIWPDLGMAHPMAHHAMQGVHREALPTVPTTPLLLSLKLTIAVLVIACPCALGLATPTALLVGSGLGAERGLLIRGGDVLEKAFKLKTIVFDKTGTLTLGQAAVTDIWPVAKTSPHDLLQLAATVESGTQHPLAQAIVAAAQAKSLTLLAAQDFQTIAGSGVAAQVQWQGTAALVRLGTLNWFADLGLTVAATVVEQAAHYARSGKTVVAIALDQQLLGLMAISDRPRPEASAMIRQLQRRGLVVMMLTGDRHETAQAIAEELGIAAQNVLAEVKPDQKAQTIAQLQSPQHLVAMVGDGINDAPAIAQADVGIALQTGTEVAAATADILLMRNSLNDVVAALTLSQGTFRKIRQNLFWAFVYNIVAIPIAAGVLLPFYQISLSPSNAGLLMALSSISVVTNSLLLRWQWRTGSSG